MSKASELSTVILKRIRKNVYVEKIPGERSLAAEFEVDFKTANRAVALLVEQGILYRKRGEGTFVVPTNKRRDLTLGLCFFKHTDPGRDPVFNRFFAGVNHAAKTHRLRLDVTALKDIFANQLPTQSLQIERFKEDVFSTNPDGLIYLGNVNPALIDVLRADRPLIVVAQLPGKSEWHNVRRDIGTGTGDAVRRLAAQGHRKITLATYQPTNKDFDLIEKERGYGEAIATLGLEPHILRMPTIPGEQLASLIHKISPRPTAVVATESTLGLSIMQHASKLGLRIPTDLAVISFDDGDHGAFTQPPMSSIHAFGEELAHLAVKRMVELLDGVIKERINETLPCAYVERESSAHSIK